MENYDKTNAAISKFAEELSALNPKNDIELLHLFTKKLYEKGVSGNRPFVYSHREILNTKRFLKDFGTCQDISYFEASVLNALGKEAYVVSPNASPSLFRAIIGHPLNLLAPIIGIKPNHAIVMLKNAKTENGTLQYLAHDATNGSSILLKDEKGKIRSDYCPYEYRACRRFTEKFWNYLKRRHHLVSVTQKKSAAPAIIEKKRNFLWKK